MRGSLYSQLPFLAFLLWLAAVPLLLTSAFSFYSDTREIAFVCDEFACAEDGRSWSERNAWLLGITVLTLVAALATSMAALRGHRGRAAYGRWTHRRHL